MAIRKLTGLRVGSISILLMLMLLLTACGGRQAEAPERQVQTETSAAPPAGVPLAPETSAVQEAPAMTAAPDVPAGEDMFFNMGEAPEPEFGNILFNPPTQMIRDKTERIEVRISRDVIDETGLQGEGSVIKDTVRVSDQMSVTLYGDKFKVVNITDTQQLVEQSGHTEWSFDVTPLEAADGQILTLKVTIHLASGLKNKLVYSKPITIDVDGKSAVLKWLANNWKLLTLLLFTSVLVAYVVRNLRGGKKAYKRSGNEAIFISYRRDDSSGYTLAIYEQLKKVFGDDAVFMDLDDIPHGEDFAIHIDKVLSKANTLLVMIGEQWVNARNAKGQRLGQPDDFVRLEIAKALQRNIRLIPVLLKNAQMPGSGELPEVLQPLTRKNAIRIHDDQFEASIQRLVDAIAAK